MTAQPIASNPIASPSRVAPTDLTFCVEGDARGKGRPRATARGGFARVYTDAKTRAYESAVKGAAAIAMGARGPMEGPLALSLLVRMGVPKSFSKRRRAAILSGAEPYFGQFDADNIAKSVLDGCNDTVFFDDRQVMALTVVKQPAETPGVDVRVARYQAEAA